MSSKFGTAVELGPVQICCCSCCCCCWLGSARELGGRKRGWSARQAQEVIVFHPVPKVGNSGSNSRALTRARGDRERDDAGCSRNATSCRPAGQPARSSGSSAAAASEAAILATKRDFRSIRSWNLFKSRHAAAPAGCIGRSNQLRPEAGLLGQRRRRQRQQFGPVWPQAAARRIPSRLWFVMSAGHGADIIASNVCRAPTPIMVTNERNAGLLRPAKLAFRARQASRAAGRPRLGSRRRRR